MGGIYNPFNLGSYTYAHLQPLKISDPDGRIAIADDVVIGAGIVIVAGAVYVSDPNNRKAMARAAEQGVENFKSNVQWLGEKIENLVFNEDSSGQSQAEKQKPREVGKNEELPKQGLVSGGVEGAPPVDAGKQGKHVPGHNNEEDGKSKWREGENGVGETQQAWGNGVPVKPDGSVRVGTGESGRTIKVHQNKQGNIHGYPVERPDR
jgi:hypothetical protein